MSEQTRKGIAISATTLILMFVMLEAGTRLLAGIPLTYSENVIEAKRILLKGTYPSQYDALLGWIPKPGDYEPDDNIWQIKMTIRDNGIRLNNQVSRFEDLATASKPRILAVGDSFTFGDEVNDDETWPAILEAMSQISVVNGGVFGYGIDQTILRAEVLADEYKPEILIVGMITDDIERAEFSRRGSIAKPYFELENGKLILRNTPPDPARPELKEMSVAQKIFGYSLFLDLAMNAANLQNIWYGIIQVHEKDTQVHEKGVEVSCVLLKRLDELGQRQGFKTILLIQYLEGEIYREKGKLAQEMATCAQRNNILVLDLYSSLREVSQEDSEEFQSFYHTHMSPAGNKFVAERIHTFLLQEELIRSSGSR